MERLARIAKPPRPLGPTIDALRLVPQSSVAATLEPSPSSEVDEAKRRNEARQAAILASDRYAAAGVPTRYRLTVTTAKHPRWVTVYNHARAIVDNAGSTVVLTGSRGTGKTHMACELIRHACATTTARYETWADVLRRWREALTDGGESERKVVGDFSRVGLLVVDEIEVAKDGEFGDRCMRELIDRRYRNLRSTVLLSNLSVEALSARLDPSILSRMQECGEIIPCDWPSFRLNTATAGGGT